MFRHCPKALRRAALWDPERWDPGALPSTARMVTMVQEVTESLAELEAYYGPSYARRLYGSAGRDEA